MKVKEVWLSLLEMKKPSEKKNNFENRLLQEYNKKSLILKHA